MQEKHLFEYAVIRIVPRVEREEFLNAGIILYCPTQKFLQTKFKVDEERLRICFSGLLIPELKAYLHAFEQIASGNTAQSPIAALDIASRFRWLTAARSTIVQTSNVHPGLCADAAAMLNRLYAQLVEV